MKPPNAAPVAGRPSATAPANERWGADELLRTVYDELRRLAVAKLAREQPGQTLQATALVHEAYLRLVGSSSGQCWNSPGHFFAAAGEAMRRILVDNARRKGTAKHGGDWVRRELEEVQLVTSRDTDQLLAVHEVLDRLEQVDPLAAQLVKLHYFTGLTIEETAQALGLGVRKAYLVWSYARCWLRREIGSD